MYVKYIMHWSLRKRLSFSDNIFKWNLFKKSISYLKIKHVPKYPTDQIGIGSSNALVMKVESHSQNNVGKDPWPLMSIQGQNGLNWYLAMTNICKFFMKLAEEEFLYDDDAPFAHIDELVQERCNSIANALELHLSCTNP